MGYYRLPQIKVPVSYNETLIREEIKRKYGIKGHYDYKLVKRSVDARKKPVVYFVFTVDVFIPPLTKNKKLQNQKYYAETPRYENVAVKKTPQKRPIIIGMGPAGLFAGLLLSEAGYKPIILERGKAVEERIEDVNRFFDTGVLNESSNIQFGEGGAGTFSDGKINTGVKDKFCRIDKIVETFIDCGAPEDIAISNKPHIGTDYLIEVVKNMRHRIIDNGGEVRFDACVTDMLIENNRVSQLCVNHKEWLETDNVVLAVGHSARDTFEWMVKRAIPMTPKAFAVGLRIEHPQTWINKSQYGDCKDMASLPVADYKLTYRTSKERAVYTFCMCPGGFVVNAASETGGLVCNGMSNYLRDEINANSAVLVNVHPDDFGSDDVLAGVEFQRHWERNAYELTGKSNALPVQRYEDYKNKVVSTNFGLVRPNTKGKTMMVDLNQCLPSFVADAIVEGIDAFGKRIKGFAHKDAVLTGVETRSSSPVRMERNDNYESPIAGLYPCGEGAGYAGGIMSAALDGIKVAEAIIHKTNDE